MKLSDGEKLILMMLSELYEKIGVEGEIDPKFVKEAITSDNAWGLKWEYSGILSGEDKDPEIVSEVTDILQMWWLLESAYERLDPDEKKRVDQEITPFTVKFDGFDGNNEPEHMSVASFMIETLGRFEHFKGRYLNSHSMSLEPHRRMLAKYRPLLSKLGTRQINAEDIILLVKARAHP